MTRPVRSMPRTLRVATGCAATVLSCVLSAQGVAHAADTTKPAGASRASRHHSYDDVPQRTGQEASIGRAVLSLLNQERADNGRPALSMNAHLLLSARRHDLAMARTNTISHQCAGEPDLGSRITDAGYHNWTWVAENVALSGTMTRQAALDLEQAMYGEQAPNDGHRQNILSTAEQDVGVDVYLDSTNHKIWITEDFGGH